MSRRFRVGNIKKESLLKGLGVIFERREIEYSGTRNGRIVKPILRYVYTDITCIKMCF